MRVISDKLVLYKIDGDAEIVRGRGWMDTDPSLNQQMSRKPSMLPRVGRESQPLGHAHPKRSRFSAPGKSLSSLGKAATNFSILLTSQELLV